jgi:hypothetical protein
MAGGYALGTGLYQQPKDFQPVVLGKRGKCRDGVCRFHISTNIEIMIERQATERPATICWRRQCDRRVLAFSVPEPRAGQPKYYKATIVAYRADPERPAPAIMAAEPQKRVPRVAGEPDSAKMTLKRRKKPPTLDHLHRQALAN